MSLFGRVNVSQQLRLKTTFDLSQIHVLRLTNEMNVNLCSRLLTPPAGRLFFLCFFEIEQEEVIINFRAILFSLELTHGQTLLQ